MNRFVNIPDKGIEKESSLLGALGLAGLIHVAPNVGMKAIKSTEQGHKALGGSFSAGVNHGKTGRKLHPNAQSFMEYGVGPESLLDYHVGKRVGKRLGKYEDNPARQEVFLDRVKKKFGLLDISPEQIDELKNTPVLGSAYRHFSGETNKGVEKALTKMSVPEDAKKTLGQRAGNLAMLAGAGAADPHLLLQPAFSYGRKQVAKTELGKSMLKSNFEKAVDGKEIPKWKERLIDTVVSPGVLDTHRVGKFTRNNVEPESIELAKGLAKEVGHGGKINYRDR